MAGGAPIHVREAAAGYADRVVLRDLDLVIAPGERVAVLGRSGAGKSTLLDLVFARCAGAAALIPQAAALVAPLSVFHNVYMGRLDRHPTWYNLKTLVRPSRADVGEVRAVLDAVGLGDALFQRAGELSGGQQQRTSVARALYNGRPIVVGDEPVSALDRAQGRAVLDTLARRHETLVLALHDVGLALAFATRVIAIDGGRVVLDAPADGLDEAALAPLYRA